MDDLIFSWSGGRNMDKPRNFMLFCVGIPKTGTTSLATIFGNHRSEHEFMFGLTAENIIAHHQGLMSQEEFRNFLVKRSRAGSLEMDSSSFNHHYLDFLVEEFPEAKFVFTIRDCYSWLNSFLNMPLTMKLLPPESWKPRWMDFMIEGFKAEYFASEKTLIPRLPELLEGFLSFWSLANSRALSILDLLPKEKVLIIRTPEISSSLKKLATFAGVPLETLRAESHSYNRGPGNLDFLRAVDRKLLKSVCTRHCTPLMNRFFPDVTLEATSILNGSSIQPLKPGTNWPGWHGRRNSFPFSSTFS